MSRDVASRGTARIHHRSRRRSLRRQDLGVLLLSLLFEGVATTDVSQFERNFGPILALATVAFSSRLGKLFVIEKEVDHIFRIDAGRGFM